MQRALYQSFPFPLHLGQFSMERLEPINVSEIVQILFKT